MHADILSRFLVEGVDALDSFSSSDWATLVRDARRGFLLSTVAARLASADALDRAPGNLRWHLRGALQVGRSSSRTVRWEVREIYRVLRKHNIPFALLKGAAYEMIEAAPSPGRLFSDVDILVHREDLESAESAFARHGWLPGKLDAYDQKYYRKWMHEIPPLTNLSRRTSLDVHHTIIPPTAAPRVDVDLLWKQAVEVPGWRGMFVLSPHDMVLHSATHLFHDGDLDGGYRDLVDLDGLLRQYCGSPESWAALLERAQALDLQGPLHYALKHTRNMLDTPVPEAIQDQAQRAGGSGVLAAPLMEVLVAKVLDPRR